MKTVLKNLTVYSILLTAFISTACSNAIPVTRSIFGGIKINGESSPRNAITVAAGTSTDGSTYKVNYSINMVNGGMPATDGLIRVRASDPQVLHHAHP